MDGIMVGPEFARRSTRDSNLRNTFDVKVYSDERFGLRGNATLGGM